MLESKGLLEQHGYKKDSPQETEGTALASTNGPISNQRHACTRCNKTFPRKCELKKHEQRHEKPYGCTHPGCNKRFGSKNDWKRHENSQHFPLESWRCDMKRREDPSSICTFVNHQRFFFRQHLQEAHSLGMNELESKVDGCKVGRNSEVRFWCGFCEAVIENKRKGAQAHNERFNHIGDHFSGRNNRERRDITDWKGALSHESGTLPPAALTSQAKSCRTTRPQPQDANFVRSKRKRDINHSDRPPKRPKAKGTDEVDEANNPGVFPCCHCGELLHAGSKQCMNPDCFHVQCVNCE
ncbi:hypothetical protein GGR56DRAFT_650812 [Xylariaceae sp. FL0804]|nr:hypothetical protein GGR56DRAFT_650812 [Xylariaceae sp. FL0804]